MAWSFRPARGKTLVFRIFILATISIGLLLSVFWKVTPFAQDLGNRPGKLAVFERSSTEWAFSGVLELSHEAETPPSCKPVTNVLFLKTHKTGSSTMTNILNRFGDSRDLLFALPFGIENIAFRWPKPFQVNYTLPLRRAPNILCNHARYNRVPMNWLFPKETTRYITILREPTEQFESIFNYYHVERWKKRLRLSSKPLETFLENPEMFWNKNPWLMKNPALFDLGLFPIPDNIPEVRDYIHFLEREFDLVLLKEYFDESLVLMKRRFCWNMEDILYFKLNERMEDDKGNLTSDTREKIQKWNWGDVLLYNVFNQTFWDMITQEGPEFYVDLALFRKEMESRKNECLQEGEFLTSPFDGKLVVGYELKVNLSKELKKTCSKMIINELPYMNYLREKMIKKREALDTSL